MGTIRASSLHTAAGCASSASSAVVRCTSAGSWLITATRVPRLDERAGVVGVLPKHRRSDGEHDVVGSERFPQTRPIGGQVAGEEVMILRKPGPGAERFLPHRAAQPLGQRHERLPGLGIVGSGSDDERRAGRPGDELGEPLRRPGRHGSRSHDPTWSGSLIRLLGFG